MDLGRDLHRRLAPLPDVSSPTARPAGQLASEEAPLNTYKARRLGPLRLLHGHLGQSTLLDLHAGPLRLAGLPESSPQQAPLHDHENPAVPHPSLLAAGRAVEDAGARLRARCHPGC